MTTAAIQAARDWAAEHRHPQPDDRMLRVALAVAFNDLANEVEARAESIGWYEAGILRAHVAELLRDRADEFEDNPHPAYPGDAR